MVREKPRSVSHFVVKYRQIGHPILSADDFQAVDCAPGE
jgi:hypothetical protein